MGLPLVEPLAGPLVEPLAEPLPPLIGVRAAVLQAGF